MTSGSADELVFRVDIGILAHNEEDSIGALLEDLAQQDILSEPGIDLRVWVLANGCTDATAAVAHRVLDAVPEALQTRIDVLEIEAAGKSRTMHRYIHDISRSSADVLGFMDADIRLPRSDTLRRMIMALRTRKELQAYVSCPIKDIDYHKMDVSFIPRLIAAGGGGLADFRKSICGQLFMLRAPMARQIALPAGLPVEDGFIRAMVLTDLMTAPEDFDRIDGDEDIFHIYDSIRSVGELLRHQTRLVVGSAVNTALFGKLSREAETSEQAYDILLQGAADPDWLSAVLKEELPRSPYGYVPFSFLTNRVSKGRFRQALGRGPKGVLIMLVGTGLDVVVYIRAFVRMMRGGAAGHW